MGIIQQLSKRAAIFIITVLAMAVATPAFAWGPERQTYTNEVPADYATFNSIVDNAAVGDERNFVRIGEVGSTDPYVDTIEVIPGKEYEVYIYYHNNAASNTNETGFGVATDTRITSAYPTLVKPGEKGMVSGIISWSYVTPDDPDNPQNGKVWDEAYVTSTEDVTLRYKTGTATIHNSGQANGSALSTKLFTDEGVLIGFNKLGGVLPGCAEYSGYITYTLVAEKKEVDFKKQVSLDGKNWSKSVKAKHGDYVTYSIEFKNNGNTNLTNVIFQDVHDEGLTLKPGSVKIFDLNNPGGKVIDDILHISGYNSGDLVPSGLVQIIYQAQVDWDNQDICNKKLNNKMIVKFDSTEELEDNAEVEVECKTPDELPNTGPLEIVMATVVIIGIGGGGYYLYRTRKTLNKVESVAKGESTPKVNDNSQIDEPKDKTDE